MSLPPAPGAPGRAPPLFGVSRGSPVPSGFPVLPCGYVRLAIPSKPRFAVPSYFVLKTLPARGRAAPKTPIRPFICTSNQLKDECHEVKWIRIEPEATKNCILPVPRHGHRAIPYEHFMIVFGGGNGGLLGDVNIYDSQRNEWSQPKTKGIIPPGKAGYGAVIDGRRILIFGGLQEGMGCSNQLYELDIEKWEWTLLKPVPRTPEEQPCGRFGHSFTLINNKVFMFGGMHGPMMDNAKNQPDATYLNDLYTLDVRQNMEHGAWEIPVVQGTPPCPRESHSAVKYKNKLIIYGGMYGSRLGDLHTLDLDCMTWTEVKYDGRFPRFPTGRSLHSASVIGDRMYVFGGWVHSGDSYDATEVNSPTNLWVCDCLTACLNMKTMTWEKIVLKNSSLDEDALPESRAGHSAAVINNKIYIWSGRDGHRKKYYPEEGTEIQVCFNDLWKLEVQKPGTCDRVKMIEAEPGALNVCWDPVPGADGYILQLAPY